MNQNKPIEKIKILFLASNPKDTQPLALDEEVREITQKIRASQHRDAFDFKQCWAILSDDLLQAFNEEKPHIVHFSGHGTSTGEIILLDKNRKAKTVSTQAIKYVFSTLKDNIRLVLLNACYSRTQAEAIAEVIDCVIGMNTAIGDEAAIVFAASFYRAIGFGRDVINAFEQGITALMLEGISEENTPDILHRKEVNPKEVLLVSNLSNSEIKNPNTDVKIVDYTKTEPKAEPEVELKSEVDVDYSHLKELLISKKWKEADEETARVMIKAAKQEQKGYLDLGDIEKVPCADLRTIDQLWVKYSNGKFGFSVQKKIYIQCGGKLDAKFPENEIMYQFSQRVGWQVNREWISYEKLTFDTSAPTGHLPVCRDCWLDWIVGIENMDYITKSPILNCSYLLDLFSRIPQFESEPKTRIQSIA